MDIKAGFSGYISWHRFRKKSWKIFSGFCSAHTLHKITYIHQPRPLLQGAGGYLIPIVKRVTCAPNLIYGRTTDGINLKQHFLEIRASYPKRYIHDCGRSRPRRHGRRIHEFTLVLVLVLVLLFCLISVERTLLNPSYPRSPAFRSPRIRRRRGA